MAVYYPDGGPGAYAQNQQGRQDDQFRQILQMMMMGMQEKTRKQQYTDQLQQQQVENQRKNYELGLSERRTEATERGAEARMITANKPTPEPEWKFKVRWIAELKDPKEKKKAVDAFLGIPPDRKLTPGEELRERRYQERVSILNQRHESGEMDDETYLNNLYGITPPQKTGTLKLAEEMFGLRMVGSVKEGMEKIQMSSQAEVLRMMLAIAGLDGGESPGGTPQPSSPPVKDEEIDGMESYVGKDGKTYYRPIQR